VCGTLLREVLEALLQFFYSAPERVVDFLVVDVGHEVQDIEDALYP
jgi:hypothetical protein